MLSDEITTGPRSRVSWRCTAQAWPPSTRGLPLPTVAAVLAMATVPVAALLARGADDFSGAVISAILLSGATAGYLVEDPAGDTLSASPTSLARRRLLRLAAIALAVAVTLLVAVVAATTQVPIGPLRLADRAAELLAVTGVAAGTAGLVQRSGGAAAAPTGAVAGPLSALLISSLALRFHGLPAIASSANHNRWWIVALVGWTTAAWVSRDPYR